MNCCCQVVSETSGASGESQDRHNKCSLSASDHDGDNKVGVGNCQGLKYCAVIICDCAVIKGCLCSDIN